MTLSATLCRLPAATLAAPAVVAPVSTGQGVGSNLDATGRRIVKKGCTVSHGGLRYYVARVRLGHITCYPVRFRRGVDYDVESVLLVARSVLVVAA